MRFDRRVAVLVLLAAGFSSLASPRTRRADAGSAAPILATLERTACYGICPSYEVTVRTDGTVEYEGRRFVKVRGHQLGKLNPRQLAELRAAFSDAKFFALEDRFACYEATDNPSAIVTFRSGDKVRTLRHYYGCLSAPKTMATLERKIDEIAGTEKWVGTQEERENLRE